MAEVAHSVSFGLTIYATVVATVLALWTLFVEVFQRVSVHAQEMFLVKRNGRQVRMSPGVAEDLGIPEADRRPILTITVRNRGRRAVQIEALRKRYWFSHTQTTFSTDTFGALPATIEPGHSGHFNEGDTTTTYVHGSLGRLSRFYAVDGAGRVYPLRERWLQSLENVLYHRPHHWRQRRTARRP
jgi:hypothetical protein